MPWNRHRREDNLSDGSRDHQLSNKIDYQPSNRDSISGRFGFYKHSETGNECAGSPICTSNRTLLNSRDYTALINWTRNLRPDLINQARFQFSPDTAAQTRSVNPAGSELNIGGVGTFGRSFTAPFNTFVTVASDRRWLYVGARNDKGFFRRLVGNPGDQIMLPAIAEGGIDIDTVYCETTT